MPGTFLDSTMKLSDMNKLLDTNAKIYINKYEHHPSLLGLKLDVICLHTTVHVNQIVRNFYTHCSLKQPVRVFYFSHRNLKKPSLLKFTLLKLISVLSGSVVTLTRISWTRDKLVWIFLCDNEGIK
jgi:hypothetical protein